MISMALLLLTSLLIILAEAKRRKGSSASDFQAGNLSLPGVQIAIDKSFTNFTLSTGQFKVFYAVLGKQDALDLHRIHCVITNARELKSEGLHFLQVTVSNGRGSISFSLPETASNGTLLYEGARIIHPLDVTDFEGNHKQTLTATVLSRSFVNVSINIRFTNYDRSQYDVKLPSTTPSVRFLNNQRVGYVRPLSYRLTTTEAQVLRILVESEDDLCAQMVVTKNGANPYVRNSEHGTNNNDVLHEMEFTRRLDLVLYRENVPQVLLMFIFVYSDDMRCEPGAAGRTPNNLKLFNITWIAEDGLSLLAPISVSIAFYLVPVASALIYAWVVDLSKGKGDSQNDEWRRAEGLECLSPPPSESGDMVNARTSDPVELENVLDVSRGTDSTLLELTESESGVHEEVIHGPDTRTVLRTVGTSWQDEEWSWSSAQFALVLLPILSLIIALPSYGPPWSDDNCFHNYACSEPFWIFTSFNHVFSNVGYVLCSFVFLLFTKLRKGKLTIGHGAYNNYGLEVCMGLSLLCEALASSIYHLCPNSITYNLDTPFIEVLCVLVMLKLFGNRRGTIKARTANMAAVLVIFVDSIITMFAERSSTRFLVIMCLPFLVLLGVGKVFGPKVPVGLTSALKEGCRQPVIVLVGVMAVNILLAATFILPADRIQPNQIVTVICLANTSLYFLYYIFMKWHTGEQLCKFSRISSATAAVLWMFALYFFLIEETDWTLTPAQSRAHNRPCTLLSFYDYHDLWHITSSLASLMTLMAVSTLDDAVSALPTGELAVF